MSHNSLHSANTLIKNPVYSTLGSQNISANSSHGTGTKNMKSHLSKKMIKNFVNTHREAEKSRHIIDLDKERALSNEKKLNTYRKGVTSKNKKTEAKRPKSSLEKASKCVSYTFG